MRYETEGFLTDRQQDYNDGYEDAVLETMKTVAKYEELMAAVKRKFHGETPHETALRYILESEKRANTAAKSSSCGGSAKPWGLGGSAIVEVLPQYQGGAGGSKPIFDELGDNTKILFCLP